MDEDYARAVAGARGAGAGCVNMEWLNVMLGQRLGSGIVGLGSGKSKRCRSRGCEHGVAKYDTHRQEFGPREQRSLHQGAKEQGL